MQDFNNTYDKENIFAKILRGEIPCSKVYENEFCLAFNDINPQADIHVLVIPKKEYISMDDFSSKASSEEINSFFRAVGEVARKLGVDNSGYRIIANHGADSHQEVPHFHVHILGGNSLGTLLVKGGK
ncbi:MAG: histidine triad nucleotide-binding protein [Rhodospirillaceae bacterium]|nr:histidine triad nucleotide-binding protein [Rhodospirillaceae bacterium]